MCIVNMSFIKLYIEINTIAFCFVCYSQKPLKQKDFEQHENQEIEHQIYAKLKPLILRHLSAIAKWQRQSNK